MLALRNRIVGVFIALVGLIIVVVGIGLLATAGWKTADGTVVSCRAHIVGSSGSRHTQQDCVVTWQDGGVTRSDTVSLGGAGAIFPGTHETLQVHGDSATVPSPMWARVTTLGVGAALMITGLVIGTRGRRRRSGPQSKDLLPPIQPG